MKKILCLFLSISMLVCIGGCQSKSTEETGIANTLEVTVDAEKEYLENLPEKDYDGYEFTVLCTTQTENFYNVSEYNADLIESSVYSRNVTVKDKYNVDFWFESLNGNRGGMSDFQSRVRNATMSGSGGYDAVVAQCYYMLPLASEGHLRNLNDSDYFHFDMPWYNDNINKNGVINGKLYGASGSYIMSQISYAMGMFFNKVYYENNQFEDDLYELVRNKEWTYEKLYQMSADYYVDSNNNTVRDESDIFGYVYHLHGIEASIVGSDCPIVEFDSSGMPNIDNYYDQHLIDVFEDYFRYYNNSRGVWLNKPDAGPTTSLGEGRALFASAQLGMMVDCAQLRNSSYEYGIVPMPLYDTEQEDYFSYTMRWELFYIPSNVDFERSAIVLEYLNYTSEKIVVPAYWETALNERAADTSDDSQMLHLIKDTLYYDFASFFGMEMGGIYRDPTGVGGIPTLIENGNSGIASWWNSGKEKFSSSLDDIIKKYS